MELFKVTATHASEHIRVALAATTENVQAKKAMLEASGHWTNIEVHPFVPMFRQKGAR